MEGVEMRHRQAGAVELVGIENNVHRTTYGWNKSDKKEDLCEY